MDRLRTLGLLAILLFQWGCSSNTAPSTPTSSSGPTYTYPFSFFIGDYGISGSVPGRFQGPGQMAVYNNTLFVVDLNDHRIQKFDANGNFLGTTTVGGASTLWGIAAYNGFLYIGDNGNNSLFKYDTNLNFVGTISASIALNAPTDMAVDGSGRLYFANHGNSTLERCANDGTGCVTVGGPGSALGQLNGIYGVAVDNSGNVYVAEQNNNRVQKFNSSLASPSIIISVGTGNGQVASPIAAGIDPDGNLFVSDTPISDCRIQKFSPAGSYLATISPPNGYTFGAANILAFAWDSNKNFFASDYTNKAIFRFAPY